MVTIEQRFLLFENLRRYFNTTFLPRENEQCCSVRQWQSEEVEAFWVLKLKFVRQV